MISSVETDTATVFGSACHACAEFQSAGLIQPAICAATGTSSRPMTATMAPIAACRGFALWQLLGWANKRTVVSRIYDNT